MPDTDPAATSYWLETNRTYAGQWPNIVSRKPPLPDADAENGRGGKTTELSPNPGQSEHAA